MLTEWFVQGAGQKDWNPKEQCLVEEDGFRPRSGGPEETKTCRETSLISHTSPIRPIYRRKCLVSRDKWVQKVELEVKTPFRPHFAAGVSVSALHLLRMCNVLTQDSLGGLVILV